MNFCEKCKDWGSTITLTQNNQAIACTNCGRLTWPNLGVNCHAGSAVSFGSTNWCNLLGNYLGGHKDETESDNRPKDGDR